MLQLLSRRFLLCNAIFINAIFINAIFINAIFIVSIFLWQSPTLAAESQLDPKLEQQILEVIRRNPEVILESLQRYQQAQQQKAQKAQQAILNRLKTDRKQAIGQSPTYNNGRILLIEFSDFQCPYCAKARLALKAFADKYPDRITLVYKHFPLSQIHSEALNAAKASWAAQQQNKFWEFHDALFEQQKAMGPALYTSIAKNLGLDLAQFDRDRNSPQAQAAIEQDQNLADSLGIDGTPAIVLNGKLTGGALSVTELEKLLPPQK
jgi:protein-disulfide isomerase